MDLTSLLLDKGLETLTKIKTLANFNLVDPIERNIIGVLLKWVGHDPLPSDNLVYGSCIATLRFTQAGVEDGMVGLRWKASQSKVASSTIDLPKC
ncbi:hypothetical protein FNV43_RR05540 [Rhamnella rubrinervis]|uniref:Uncharacterized protein n=1 Tax=Rhamnella rubrinervis TaxID=2594499 RepID=A0A8K0MQR7_9ROSA|nr:hypothetical protein FNV43_RR05540 [Rhamnella rubrinervis]